MPKVTIRTVRLKSRIGMTVDEFTTLMKARLDKFCNTYPENHAEDEDNYPDIQSLEDWFSSFKMTEVDSHTLAD